jgi:hypothetical protein
VPLVKGVWFVTARRYILEHRGETDLHAVAERMREEHRSTFLEPLASAWYHEDAFDDAVHAVMRALAHDDPVVFLRLMEDCTVLGIHTFFRILLRVTSLPFLLRKMPVLSRQYRRNDWTCDVEADDRHATIRFGRCPYLASPVYGLYVQAMLTKVCELGSGRRPECAVARSTPTSIVCELRY